MYMSIVMLMYIYKLYRNMNMLNHVNMYDRVHQFQKFKCLVVFLK
jgi:hypothetical protein